MNTRPPETAGVLVKSPVAIPRHSGWHNGWPHPLAGQAFRLPSKPAWYKTPLATAGPPSVPVLLPKSAVNMVRSCLTLLLVKVFSAGLVLRWRGEWPNCGHSLGVLAAGRALAAAPAGAVVAARLNG